MGLKAEIIRLFHGERTFETGALAAMINELASGPGKIELEAGSPDKTFTISSGTTNGTKMWQIVQIPSIWSLWLMTTEDLFAEADTTGAIDAGAFTAAELPVGSFVFGIQQFSATQSHGLLVVKSFTAGSPISNIDLSNVSSFGLANTD